MTEELKQSAAWVLYEDEETNAWECSACHEVQWLMEGSPFDNKWYYCPFCGATMKKEIDNMEELKPCPFCGGEFGDTVIKWIN